MNDSNHALRIYAGTDNFLKIGEPNSTGMRQNMSIEEMWQEQCEKMFKKVEEDHIGGGIKNLE